MDKVSVKQFREYYHLAEDEVSDAFLKGYIKERDIKQSDLEQRDWAKVAKALFDRGVTYGYNITKMIARKYRFIQSDRDYENVTHIILQMEIPKENGLSEPRYFVLDMEDNRLYYSTQEIRLDYTKAEVSVCLSEECVDRMINNLRASITAQWENPSRSGAGNDYHWDLFVILSGDEMVWYNGDGINEEERPGFDSWYQCLYKEIDDAQ